MSPRRGALVVMTKAPRVGRVKTRLAAGLGEAAADRLYRAFLADVLKRVERVAERVEARPVVADSGADVGGASEDDWCPRSFERLMQRGDDLGARMGNAIEDAGGQRVVLIGGDSPTMPDERLEEAFAAADAGVIALGPVADGGYDLIAMPQLDRRLFEDIPWSSSSVFERSMDRAREAGLSVRILSLGYDVDVLEDVERLARDPALSANSETAKALSELGLRGRLG